MHNHTPQTGNFTPQQGESEARARGTASRPGERHPLAAGRAAKRAPVRQHHDPASGTRLQQGEQRSAFARAKSQANRSPLAAGRTAKRLRPYGIPATRRAAPARSRAQCEASARESRPRPGEGRPLAAGRAAKRPRPWPHGPNPAAAGRTAKRLRPWQRPGQTEPTRGRAQCEASARGLTARTQPRQGGQRSASARGNAQAKRNPLAAGRTAKRLRP